MSLKLKNSLKKILALQFFAYICRSIRKRTMSHLTIIPSIIIFNVIITQEEGML